MKNRTQSFTSISFDTDRASSRDSYLSKRQAAKTPDSVTAAFAGQTAGKNLLDLCQEIAGVVLKRYLVSDSAAEVRADTACDLRLKLSCSDRQAQALISLALELIHVKSYGRYRCTPARLEQLIARASGVAGS